MKTCMHGVLDQLRQRARDRRLGGRGQHTDLSAGSEEQCAGLQARGPGGPRTSSCPSVATMDSRARACIDSVACVEGAAAAVASAGSMSARRAECRACCHLRHSSRRAMVARSDSRAPPPAWLATCSWRRLPTPGANGGSQGAGGGGGGEGGGLCWRRWSLGRGRREENESIGGRQPQQRRYDASDLRIEE